MKQLSREAQRWWRKRNEPVRRRAANTYRPAPMQMQRFRALLLCAIALEVPFALWLATNALQPL